MAQSRLWQEPIWISYESSSSWCLNMKAFTSPLSHDHCPPEIGSLSCTLQRDSTAPGNHKNHQTQTPSRFINKRTVCSTERNNRLVVSSALRGKVSVGGSGVYLYFLFPVGEMMRQIYLWEFLVYRPSKAWKKLKPTQRLAIEEWNTELKYTPRSLRHCWLRTADDSTEWITEHALICQGQKHKTSVCWVLVLRDNNQKGKKGAIIIPGWRWTSAHF